MVSQVIFSFLGQLAAKSVAAPSIPNLLSVRYIRQIVSKMCLSVRFIRNDTVTLNRRSV